jgi:adenosylcobinamide-phosphate synthase
VLLLAVALDLAFGEPPNAVHPVAWIGRAISLGRRLAGTGPPAMLLLAGTLIVVVTAAAAALGAAAVTHLTASWGWAGVLVEAVLLKGAFSLRALRDAAEAVRGALAGQDLGRARDALGRHLVSRPTGELDAAGVASGAVESVAENLTDSWIAPLSLYLVAGLPGAWAYRAVNTADAMIGYREGVLFYLGKPAARADDVLNWLPARAAALGIVAAAALAGESAAGAWRVMRRDGPATASPNAGRTMAAMAGALGVVLTKPGHYRLGGGMAPDAEAIRRAVRVAAIAAALGLAAALAALAATS